jgi:tripartite-type tricarboxylate transporter receptor subunit TctC
MSVGLISRRRALLAASAFALFPIAAIGQAQDWPTKRPVRAIVPFGAGSSTDIIARHVLDEVSRQIGQTIVVENRAGASGTIGANAVAKSDPDGYTLLIHSSSHTVTPSTFTSLPYNAETDFAPVIPLATIPNVVIVNSKKGYKTLRDLVDAAKKNPGKLNYASAGAGSATHLTAERFKLSAGFEAQHVAFKGSSEALTEIIADRMDFYCSPINAAIELIKDGRVTALAVSSAQRASALPNVPTTVEAGYPDSGYEFWIGAFLPRQTPKAIVDRLHAEIVKAESNPALAKKLAELGADPMKISPSEFDALVKREIQANAAVVKAAGIKAN